jgi:hypothetical protein
MPELYGCRVGEWNATLQTFAPDPARFREAVPAAVTTANMMTSDIDPFLDKLDTGSAPESRP